MGEVSRMDKIDENNYNFKKSQSRKMSKTQKSIGWMDGPPWRRMPASIETLATIAEI